MTKKTSTKTKHRYSIAPDYDHLPELTVSQKDVDDAFGPEIQVRSLLFYCDSEWTRLFDKYYQQRIVWVTNTNVLVLRFRYDYEVDLDRTETEAQLLYMVRHIVSKPWMIPDSVQIFIDVVCEIKGFKEPHL